jgi:hypothetical protein
MNRAVEWGGTMQAPAPSCAEDPLQSSIPASGNVVPAVHSKFGAKSIATLPRIEFAISYKKQSNVTISNSNKNAVFPAACLASSSYRQPAIRAEINRKPALIAFLVNHSKQRDLPKINRKLSGTPSAPQNAFKNRNPCPALTCSDPVGYKPQAGFSAAHPACLIPSQNWEIQWI